MNSEIDQDAPYRASRHPDRETPFASALSAGRHFDMDLPPMEIDMIRTTLPARRLPLRCGVSLLALTVSAALLSATPDPAWAQAQPINIPLAYQNYPSNDSTSVNSQASAPTSQRLTITVGVNNMAPQPYLFDTGSTSFNAYFGSYNKTYNYSTICATERFEWIICPVLIRRQWAEPWLLPEYDICKYNHILRAGKHKSGFWASRDTATCSERPWLHNGIRDERF